MSAAAHRGETRSTAPLRRSLGAWADDFFSTEANRDCLVWGPYLRDLFDEYTHCRYRDSLGVRAFLYLLRGYCRTRGWHCLDAEVGGPDGDVRGYVWIFTGTGPVPSGEAVPMPRHYDQVYMMTEY